MQLLGIGGPVTVVRRFSATVLEREHALRPMEAYRVLMTFCRGAGGEQQSLVDIHQLVDPGGVPGSRAIDTEILARQARDAVNRGDLLVLDGWQVGDRWTARRRAEAPAPRADSPPEPATPPSPIRRAATPDRTAWIEFEIVDEAGRPCRGVTVTLEAPDGKSLRATADADGHVRVEGLVEGECKMTLPSVDGRDWGSE